MRYVIGQVLLLIQLPYCHLLMLASNHEQSVVDDNHRRAAQTKELRKQPSEMDEGGC